jgi:hypothetical protein
VLVYQQCGINGFLAICAEAFPGVLMSAALISELSSEFLFNSGLAAGDAGVVGGDFVLATEVAFVLAEAVVGLLLEKLLLQLLRWWSLLLLQLQCR